MWLACQLAENTEEAVSLCELFQTLGVESQSDICGQDTFHFEESTRHLFKLIEHGQDDFFLQVEQVTHLLRIKADVNRFVTKFWNLVEFNGPPSPCLRFDSLTFFAVWLAF